MSTHSTSLNSTIPATQVEHTFPAGRLTTEQLCAMYRTLWTIRRVEATLNRMHGAAFTFPTDRRPSGSPVPYAGDQVMAGLNFVPQEAIGGAMHTAIGHEAIAVGAAHALHLDDPLTCTYRGHHHALARGISPQRVIAEVLGKASGVAKGKGGSMHLIDPTFGVMSANGIVGAQVAHAAGMALASWCRGEKKVAISFFGDGAIFQGIMHETFNLAQQWKLPMIFFCENNRLSEMTHIHQTSSVQHLYQFVHAYGMKSMQINGNDLEQVYQAVQSAADFARSGKGPVFIEGITYRICGHMAGDQELIRTPEEVAAQLPYEPILVTRQQLKARGVDEEEQREMEEGVERDVLDAFNQAIASPYPALSEAEEDVFA